MTKSTFLLLPLALALGLGGCAAMRNLDNDVSTWSQWPAGRKPTTYNFERLPSQQVHPEQQQALEDAARGAIEAAGFTPAADPASADVSVQLGARISLDDSSPYDDPFWWHGGLYRSRAAFGYSVGFGGPRMGFGYRWGGSVSYDREVALLMRDRQSGQAVFEARASNSSTSASFSTLLPAMFEAAMKDFPNGGVNPRRVSVEIARP